MNSLIHKRISRVDPPLLIASLITMLLVCLVLVGSVLAKKDLGVDRDTARLANAEAWQTKYEARLGGAGDLPPVVTNADDPPLAAELGGEDVLVESSDLYPEPKLEITTTGVIYIAVARAPISLGYAQVINIYRSDDGGRSFALWSVFDDPSPGQIYQVTDFVIAEGLSNRAFLSYSYGTAPNRSAKVAWAELTETAPTWNQVTVLSFPGADFGVGMDLEEDSSEFVDYFIYLVASANDDDGRDIWFTRSTDQGETWETGYRVVSHSETTLNWNFRPMISYGSNDYLHLAYQFHDAAAGDDNAIFVMRTPFAGEDGLAAWSDPTVLDTNSDGSHAVLMAIAASRTDDNVLLHLTRRPGGEYQGTSLQWSTNGGETWPTANQADTGIDAYYNSAIDIDKTSGSVWLLGHSAEISFDRVEVITQRTTLAAPGTFAPPENWCGQDADILGSGYDLGHDVSRGNQRAVVWQVYRNDTYEVYFDAEWHRAPGWPNTEAGFPLVLDGTGRTPPALANVDADPFAEIIFATEEGLIYVVNHDGTVADGWPVQISSTIPWDAPVAVGDLNDDFEPEIVVGGNNGWAYALHADGTPLTGWPRNMGTSAATYVSIGTLGTTSERQVVVCSGTSSRVLMYDGSFGPSWGLSVYPFNQPAAIGDIDNDGVNEIVSHQGASIQVHRLGNTGNLAHRIFAGETLSGMPTLADMDGDGDLEIAVGTTEGKVYLMHHDFSDYSANFPYDTGIISPVLGVVPVNLLGNNTPELVFSQIDGATHIVGENGVGGFGYPQMISTGGSIYMPPIVTTVLGPSPDVVVSASNALDCYENLGAVPPGWPHMLGDFIEESVAAGDIDLDGNIEIVALGVSQLTVLDVGSAPGQGVQSTWPMFGYNAQRTGCLDCEEDPVTAVDDPVVASPTRLAFAPPFPNPASSQTALSYALPAAAQVKLQIFDVRGRLVRTLADGQQEAGNHEVFWNGKAANGRRVALGMYLAKLAVNGPDGFEQRVRKISLVR